MTFNPHLKLELKISLFDDGPVDLVTEVLDGAVVGLQDDGRLIIR